MKEKLIQLLVCPGECNDSAACDGCAYKGKSDCFKALKADTINSLQGEVTIHKPFNLKVRVSEVLHEIGVPAHIKGYNYLRKAIMIAVERPTAVNYVTSELYPEIARTFDTTSSRVERAIRHAIEIAWERGDLDILLGYFGYTVSQKRGKATNSEFIALLADKIRLEVESNG